MPVLSRRYCRFCKTETAHEAKTANHVLHLLLSLVTCGLWIPVWIFLSFGSGPAHCRQCGGEQGTFIGGLIKAFLVGVLLLGLMVAGCVMMSN